jgi:hypothetical protein
MPLYESEGHFFSKGRTKMTMFQQGTGPWTQYRSKLTDEIDLHFGKRDRSTPYDEVMAEITTIVERSLIEAQRNGRSHVMFIHGWSTSRPGQTTARSQVRRFMRSKQATPLIERRECIQHETVFVAKVRFSPGLNPSGPALNVE